MKGCAVILEFLGQGQIRLLLKKNSRSNISSYPYLAQTTKTELLCHDLDPYFRSDVKVTACVFKISFGILILSHWLNLTQIKAN